MASTILDRVTGISTSVAVKAPCRVATTASITLSGEQTIDGVAVVAGDRVLVKNQSSSAANGIYVVDTTSWDRSEDLDAGDDIVEGTTVYVTDGTVNHDNWFVASLGATAPITIGTDTITWSQTYVALTAVSNATEAVAGVAELATQAETNTGTDDARIVTPLKLSTKLATYPITNANLATSAITGQTNDASPDRTADYVLTYDASANSLKKALIQTLGVGNTYSAKSTSYTVVAADNGGVIDFTTAGVTCGLTSAATLGAGFKVTIINSAASGIVTIDPSGSETLDGQTTRPVSFGRTRVTIISDGTNWRTCDGSYFYEATGQTVTFSADLSVSHGLGVQPDFVTIYLVNVSTDANYAVGDEIIFWTSANNSASQGIHVRVSSSNIVICQAASFAVLDKTSRTFVNITPAKWNWHIKAQSR